MLDNFNLRYNLIIIQINFKVRGANWFKNPGRTGPE